MTDNYNKLPGGNEQKMQQYKTSIIFVNWERDDILGLVINEVDVAKGKAIDINK
jgi:hypothetical protein